ncbi:hypothetical protein GUJ93_ZPchr0013g37351 [Zizania palustris]|uniref:Uncharacterized protein n=1 Tax=Zizania palustris TaxID=103762 RepID=A0A8J6C008_ZIZPA|nr:hypothetical protein GUJ93_ZPchr0013g37351 [Zizania palustris]
MLRIFIEVCIWHRSIRNPSTHGWQRWNIICYCLIVRLLHIRIATKIPVTAAEILWDRHHDGWINSSRCKSISQIANIILLSLIASGRNIRMCRYNRRTGYASNI